MPCLLLRNLVLHQAVARLEVGIEVVAQSILSAQADMYAHTVFSNVLAVRCGEVETCDAVHLEALCLVVGAGLSDGCDIEQVVEAEVKILSLQSACAPLAAVDVDACAVLGSKPVADVEVGGKSELRVACSHDVGAQTCVYEEMVEVSLLLPLLCNAWALQHIVESTAFNLCVCCCDVGASHEGSHNRFSYIVHNSFPSLFLLL